MLETPFAAPRFHCRLEVSARLLAPYASICIALSALASDAYAWGIGDFVKDAVNTSVHMVTAPAQIVINAAQAATGAKPPSAILDPVKNLGQSAGAAVTQGASLVAEPSEVLYRKAQEAAAIAGAPGAVVFDIATFADRHELEFFKSTGEAAGNILKQENPLQVVAVPLAAAIREGHEKFASIARPLPDDVRAGLSGYYQLGVIERAKFAVGTVEITLPNGIGQVKKFSDNAYAVVVDDIIVFNGAPPSFADDPWWWGHEVTHVEQYWQMGIEEFARRYVFSGGSDLENPANLRGDLVRDRAQSTGSISQTGLAVARGADVTVHPLYTSNYAKALAAAPVPAQAMAAADPAVVQCVFPGDPRPLNFYVTRTGRIVVVDRFTGQWLQIGWALPPSIPNVAWHYQAAGVFYDVFPSGQIWQRFTPYGPQQVGFTVRL